MIIEIFLSFLISLTTVLILMPPFIALMQKYRILDKAGGRKIHEGYVAHMGGIIIYIGFMVALCFLLMLYINGMEKIRMISFFIIITLMLLLGIRDDMHNVSAWAKLFFEIAIGFFIAFCGIRIHTFGGFLGLYSIPSWFSYGLTIGFFIVVTNSYNLIDGIDGQAGLQAINVFFFIALFFIFVIGKDRLSDIIATPKYIYISCVAMIGALCGFLRYNWQKAKIFMGDAGSLFIGTMITIYIIDAIEYCGASQMFDIAHKTTQYTLLGFPFKAYAAPFLCLFYLPMADTLRVFANRVRRHRSPFYPDKTHIHHLFISLGYSHQRCALTTFFISFCISLTGIVLSLLFDDNICISIIIVSWFFYVIILHKITLKKIIRIKKQHQEQIEEERK